jgi:hypothetical protein
MHWISAHFASDLFIESFYVNRILPTYQIARVRFHAFFVRYWLCGWQGKNMVYQSFNRHSSFPFSNFINSRLSAD